MTPLNVLPDGSHTLPPDPLRAVVLGRRVKASEATTRLLADLVFGIGHRTDYALSRAPAGGTGSSNMQHNTAEPNVVKILGEVVETVRKAWRISLVQEGGQTLIEMRLCRRSPSGKLAPTRHRSTFRAGIASQVAAMMAEGGARG